MQTITEATVLDVDPNIVYLAYCEDQDVTLKEPREDPNETNRANWQTVHGSPISAGNDTPTFRPLAHKVEVSATAYPLKLGLTEKKP